MKKLFLGSLLAVCALLMTSCLDGGSNTSSGVGYGVIEYKGTVKLINTGDNSIKFYSPTIDADYSIKSGDCCYFHFNWDKDIPENADSDTKGYATVVIDNYEPISTNYYAISYLTDTAEIDVNEQIVAEAGLVWDFAKDKMFFGVGLAGVLTKQEYSFDLSFNPEQKPSVVSEENVYDLYLRVIKTKKGESPVKNQAIINAYDMDSFYGTIGRKEQSAGSKKVNFRVNYVNSLNEDSTKINWKASDIMTYTFPKEE